MLLIKGFYVVVVVVVVGGGGGGGGGGVVITVPMEGMSQTGLDRPYKEPVLISSV